MSTALTAFCNATILTGEAVVEGHALLVSGTSVVDIVSMNHVPADTYTIPCNGQIIAPGLIDAQVNGGGNILLNNRPTAESCRAISLAHRTYGTTGLLLTCVSDTVETTAAALKAIRSARREDPTILGVHLEGPHLSTDKRGVHNPSALRTLTDADKALYQPTEGEIMLLTLAPESVSTADIKALSEKAVVSIGHSAAMADEVRAALEAGATGFTHLYNAMSGPSARDPGVAGIALDDPKSWCGLIADGHHVSPEMIRLALRAKPRGKLFLVSDAMAPAATRSPEPFELYGKTIYVENGSCRTKDGKLAGSCITLIDAVRYCVRKVGLDLDEAMRMASTYPAAFLGVGQKLGKLLPGYNADIIVMDLDLELQDVWPAGHA